MGFTGAALTGYFRMSSDKHWLTDVLASAAVGTGVGILVPWLHRAGPSETTCRVPPVPGGLGVVSQASSSRGNGSNTGFVSTDPWPGPDTGGILQRMHLGMGEMLVVLVIALLVFGPNKLPQLGDALGKSIHNFKKAANHDDAVDVTPETTEPAQLSTGSTPTATPAAETKKTTA